MSVSASHIQQHPPWGALFDKLQPIAVNGRPPFALLLYALQRARLLSPEIFGVIVRQRRRVGQHLQMREAAIAARHYAQAVALAEKRTMMQYGLSHQILPILKATTMPIANIMNAAIVPNKSSIALSEKWAAMSHHPSGMCRPYHIGDTYPRDDDS